MAYSTQRAVSDGTMTYLDLSIGYQSRTDIKVFYNDLPADPESWAWVGTTDKRIAFTVAVPNGIEVLVQRSTRLDRIINVFVGGAKFTNTTMDMNFEQVLFLTQEAVEGSALSDIFNDVDFHNYKIKNLGVATDPTDAITFGQVQTMSTGAYAAQLAAEAARDLAQKWAIQLTIPVDGVDYSAKQHALGAANSAASATASASAASTSASNSAASASASQTSRLAAVAAQAAAELARDEAEAAAAPATEIFDRLDAVELVADGAATAADAAQATADAIAASYVSTVAGLSGTVTVDDLREQGVYASENVTYRNLLVNPMFAVNQRGYVSGTATVVANQYTLDKWRIVTSGQSVTFGAAGPNRTVTFPAGGGEQRIEAAAVLGGPYTLSWVGTGTAKVNGVAVLNGDPVALPANTAVTVQFVGQVGKVQLELGTAVTPFEMRPPAVELSLCQRYYEKGSATLNGYQLAGNGAAVRVPFKVTKYAVPTLGYNGTTLVNVTTANASNPTVDSLVWFAVPTATGGFVWEGTWDATAEVA